MHPPCTLCREPTSCAVVLADEKHERGDVRIPCCAGCLEYLRGDVLKLAEVYTWIMGYQITRVVKEYVCDWCGESETHDERVHDSRWMGVSPERWRRLPMRATAPNEPPHEAVEELLCAACAVRFQQAIEAVKQAVRRR